MKKVWCLILCLALCLPTAGVLAKDYPDTLGLACEKAADVLLALEILYPMEDGTFQPEAAVTRADAVVTMMRLLNRGELTKPTAEEGQSYFADVDTYHWALEDINFAYDCGIISMSEDGNFRPEDAVTFPEFTKMLLSSLGYEFEAELQGGYPTGYQIKARELDLFTDVSYQADQPVTRGAAAIMLYNALHTDVRKNIGGSGYIRYYDGAPLLEEYFSLEKRTGVVTANHITGLSGAEELKGSYISIDFEAYPVTGDEAEDLLGMEVEFYVTTDTTQPEIFYCTEVGMDNTAIELVQTQNSYYYDGEKERFCVDKDNGGKSYYPLSKNVDMIYNGKLCISGNINLAPAIGSTTLIDNDSDGLYDVVAVKEYKNYIYRGYNFNDQILFLDNETESLSLNVSEDFQHKLTFVGSNPAPLDSLRENTVVSVAMSADQKYYDAIVSTSYYAGGVEALGEKNGYRLVTLGGTEHRMYPDAEAYGYVDYQSNGVFYFDFAGNVVIYESDESIVRYGFVQTVKSGKSPLDVKVQVRIFTQKGDFEVFEAAKTVNVDGEYKKTEAEIKTALDSCKGQLVRFKVSADQKLKYIDTVAGYITGDGTLRYALDINGEEIKGNKDLLYYDDPDVIGSSTGATTFVGGASIFVIPFNNLEDDESYRVVSKSYLIDATTYSTIRAYCTKSDLNAEVLVMDYGEVGEPKAGYDMVIIEQLLTAFDKASGDEYITIKGKMKGADCSYRVYPTAETAYATIATMVPGDVCMFGLDPDGNVTVVEHIYQYKDTYANDVFNGYTSSKSTPLADSNYHTRYRVIRGYVSKKEGNLIYLESDGIAPSASSVYNLTGAKFYKYTPLVRLGNRVTSTTAAEIVSKEHSGQEQYILIKTNYGKAAEVYIPYK